MELRALVPVSIRDERERNQLGNRIAVMRGPLPVYVEDPLERLATVKRAMDGLKESKQAVGAEVLAGRAELRAADRARAGLTPQLLDAALQPHRHERAGAAVPALPARPRDAGGLPRRVPPKDHALAIAIMSYNGSVNFGLLGDYDAMPDIAAVADGIEESLAELLALVPPDGAPAGKTSNGRAATAAGSSAWRA